MARVGLSALPRRLILASVVLGLFVLLDLALFSWLILRSLSQREIEETLLETRQDVEGLAQRLAERAAERGEDLYTVVAFERDTRSYIDSMLDTRVLIRDFRIVDKDGTLVFRKKSEVTIPGNGSPRVESEGRPPDVRTTEKTATYDIELPIGEYGFLQVGLDPIELEARIAVLRQELVRQATIIGIVTLGILALVYALVAWLWLRGRRLQQKARDAERLAYIGTLASGLAHEIRNPLNSLSLNMQLLEEDIESPRPGASQRLLRITRAEIGRLERLVTDFLSYARPRPVELETVRAVDLLAQAHDVISGEMRARGIRLEVVDRSGGASLRVDPGQIRQLLLNLARNAVAAVEDCGRQGRITLGARRRGELVGLEVRDNGVGIEAAEQERIFDLFYSTRKGGTGLGLAIVQRIATQHGGEVEVESTPGKGTTVRVWLRVAEERVGEAERLAPVAAHSEVSSS